MHNAGTDKRVKVCQCTSKLFLKKTDDTFDFVYVDGLHIAKDVLADAVLAWDKLKKNGILIFDDYEWKKYPQTSNLHPKMAIDAFLKIYKDEFELIGKNYQICLKKTVA